MKITWATSLTATTPKADRDGSGRIFVEDLSIIREKDGSGQLGLTTINPTFQITSRLAMDPQFLLDQLDKLVFQQTGQHLDSLQITILKGVLEGQKYADIAREYNCTQGHAKDEAYELWHSLSQLIGEDVKKSNAKSAIERFVIGCSNPQFANNNNVQIGHLNLCPSSQLNGTGGKTQETKEAVIPDSVSSYHTRAILKLAKLGVEPSHIAESLEISLDFVNLVIVDQFP